MSTTGTPPALVALAHGSRDPRSAAAVHRLLEEVWSLRPDLTVEAAFLELSEPGLDEVVARLAEAGTRDLVVVPLLLTEAYHARVDLPAAVDRAGSRHPGLRIRRAGVLGTDDALLDVLDRRLAAAPSEGGDPDGLVLTSAGSSDAAANEQVAGLARRWGARHGFPALAAFASAARPDPGEAVRRLHAEGSRRVAAGRLFLAPGTLADRAAEQAHDAGVRAVAEVLGPDPVVAGLVLARFDAVAEEGAPVSAWQDTAPAPYPSGLRLHARRVVVVGGGTAAQRRVPALLAAGADVTVVAPWVTPALEGLVGSGEVCWRPGVLLPADLEDAWYVVAAAADPSVDAATVAAAEDRRLFCERVADPAEGSATAPAVGRHGGLTVAVHGELAPRRLAEVRDRVLDGLGRADAPVPRSEQRPGVVLVGGGPGDPELITVAGRRALAEADVVVADRLAPRELLAGLATDVEVVDVGSCPADGRAPRSRSTPSSSTGCGPARGSSGSRVGTTSCSAAASRRYMPVPRRASRCRWCRGCRARCRCSAWQGSRCPIGGSPTR